VNGPTIEFIGGFESTYLPAHDADVLETTGHTAQWRQDLFLLRACGVSRLRYPVRWHRIESTPGRYDWSGTDEVLGFLRDHGFRPIVDLVHHTSYPRWLEGGFADPRFGPAYRRYAEAFAQRYPWIEEYTLFN
jgi:beta-glucosidase/6-phospho-beta-glucosidase/beta-galactosidase